jgi:hypothetical protein
MHALLIDFVFVLISAVGKKLRLKFKTFNMQKLEKIGAPYHTFMVHGAPHWFHLDQACDDSIEPLEVMFGCRPVGPP